MARGTERLRKGEKREITRLGDREENAQSEKREIIRLGDREENFKKKILNEKEDDLNLAQTTCGAKGISTKKTDYRLNTKLDSTSS